MRRRRPVWCWQPSHPAGLRRRPGPHHGRVPTAPGPGRGGRWWQKRTGGPPSPSEDIGGSHKPVIRLYFHGFIRALIEVSMAPRYWATGGGVRKAWSDNGQPRCVTTFVGDLTGRPAFPRDPVATCSYSSPVPLSSASRFSVVSSDIPASAVCDDNSGRRFHSWAR